MRFPRGADAQSGLYEQNLRSIWIVFTCGLLALAGTIGFDIIQAHYRINVEERQQLSTQATVIDENLTKSLMTVNSGLESIREELPWLLEQQNNKILLSRRLDALTDVLIGVRTLVVIDANGEVIASNQEKLLGQKFPDGERFQAIRQGGNTGILYVSAPFRTPLGIYAISVGKAMVDADGKFSGAILAILGPDFFSTLMRSVRYSDDMRASVIHGDGKLIFTTDSNVDIRPIDLSKQPNSFFNQHVDSTRELSVFSGYSASTNDLRLAVLRTVGPDAVLVSKPLVIAISRLVPAIYAQWRQQSLIKVTLLSLLALLGSLGMLAYQRRHRTLTQVALARANAQTQASIFARSERFIRSITDALPGMVAYFDKNLHCQFANKAYLDWYDKSSESIIGMTLVELMGVTLFAVNEGHINAALAGEKQQFERFLTKPDGSVGHVLANYIPEFDTDGTTIGFTVVVTDIRAFKVAEAELNLAAKVFACTSEAIMITDANRTILSVNPAFTDITGYTAQEAVGQTPRLLRSDHHSEDFHSDIWKQIAQTGLWRGEIWNRRKSGEVFLEWQTITKIPGTHADDERYVSVFHDITESWNRNESMKHLAFHDTLTNLPNRQFLMDRIARHIASARLESRSMAIMFLDLDRFKLVNDTLGHAVGDELLIVVSQKLQGLVRNADIVARLGGDEFVIMLDNPANAVEVERIASRIIAVINEPIEFQGGVAHVGTSIGIAMYPANGTTAAQLIKSADLAMYEAKRAGRNSFRYFFDDENLGSIVAPVRP